jgi:Fe-S oxidoreductase
MILTKEELLKLALHCNRCGTCRGVTQDAVPDPAFSTQCPCGMTFFGAYEPASLMYLARGIATGALKWDKTIASYLFSCTLCAYCDDLCSRGYRHTPAVTILEELRRIIPQKLKPKGLQRGAQLIKIPTAHKLSEFKRYGLPDLSDGSKTEMIILIDRSLIAHGPKLRELGFLIQKSGKRVGYFGKDPLPLVDTLLINGGYQDVLTKGIGEIDSRLKKRGVKQVICYNPESLSVLRRFSRSGVEFIPVTRFYAEMLKKKPVRKLKLPAVTYHDPCHLGRYAQDYRTPREVIGGLGLNLKEMWRSGSNALCCGAGGGMLLANPKLAKRYALNRMEEARATGAKVIITACPNCTANLKQAQPKSMEAVDITSLMAKAYGYKGKAG